MAFLQSFPFLDQPEVTFPFSYNPPIQQPMMPQIQQSNNPILDELSNLIRNQPQRTEPSLGRKILSGLSSLSAVNAGPGGAGIQSNPQLQEQIRERSLYRPYERNMNDWSTKVKNFLDAAKLENASNQQDRLLSYQMGQLANAGRKNDITEDRYNQLANDARAREERLTKQLEINSKVADARIAKMQNPNLKYFTENGKVVGYDPVTKQRVDTGIESDRMSDKDKLDLQLGNSLAEIEARKNAQIEINANKPIKPSSESPTEESELNKNRALIARAEAILNLYPEYRSYIRIKGTGTNKSIDVPPVGFLGSLGGKNEDQRKAALDLLYGNTPIPAIRGVVRPSKNAGTNTSTRGTNSNQQSLSDRVVVTDKNGNKGTIPRSQLDQALAQGYKLVQ